MKTYLIILLLIVPAISFSGEIGNKRDIQLGKINRDIIKDDINSDFNSSYDKNTDNLILYTPLEQGSDTDTTGRGPASVAPVESQDRNRPGKLMEW